MKKLLEKLLAFFSQKIIKKYNPDIIGITGSVGKSTTKHILATIFLDDNRVRTSEGNYNNEIGLPLTIIGSHHPGSSVYGWIKVFFKAFRLLFKHDISYPKIIILEMGADHPGDISYLTTLAKPHISIVTAVAPAHMEFFKDIENVAYEKSRIVSCLNKNDYAILNFDDIRVKNMQDLTDAQVIGYGQHSGEIQILFSEYIYKEDFPIGIACTLKKGNTRIPFEINGVLGDHILYPLAAAFCVGDIYKKDFGTMIESVQSMKMIAGRMNIIPGIKQTLIIDDTYNASPRATQKLIETLATLRAPARKILVLGDMLELGEYSSYEHDTIVSKISEYSFDSFIAVGKEMTLSAEKFRHAIGENKVIVFEKAHDAGAYLQSLINKGDIIAVKGSQGSRMEKIVKEIMAEPLRAKELLVRQSDYWQYR